MKKQLLLSLVTAIFYTLSIGAQVPLHITSFTANPAGCIDGPTTSDFDIAAAGGTLPYAFSVNNGPSQSTGTFLAVPISLDSLTFTVTDATNAQAVVTINNSGSDFSFYSINLTAPTCGANGAITILAQGELLPSYSIGGAFQDSGVFTKLASGQYTLNFLGIDGECDNVVANVTLVANPVVIESIGATTPTCTGKNDGSVDFVITGGTAPYIACASPVSNPQAGRICTLVNGFGFISGLTNGDYQLTVTDANGCASTETFTVLPTSELSVTAVTSPSCNGAETGSLTATAIGATATVTYTITGPVTRNNTTGLFTELPAGTYQVLAVESTLPANNCAVTTAVVAEDAPITFVYSLAPDTKSCGGIITIESATGGAGNSYSYILDGVASTGGPQQPTFTIPNTGSLSVGTHTLILTTQDCSSAITNVVVNPITITFTPVITDETCNNGNTATIGVTNIAGGSGSYLFSIGTSEGFVDTNKSFPVTSGSYSVVVKDNLTGCLSQPQIVTVLQPAPITFNYSLLAASCTTGGQIILKNVEGGSGTGYQYSLDGAATFIPLPTSGIIPATVGLHTLTLTDSSATCFSNTINFEIEGTSITFTPPTVVNETCFNGTTGSISLAFTQVAGGVPFSDPVIGSYYEYSIGTAAGFIRTGSSFNNLPASSYQVIVRDSNGCLSLPQAVEVHQPNAITFNVAVTHEITCAGAADGEITISNVQGGNGAPFRYSKGGTASTDFQASPIFGDLAPGTYTFTVADSSNTCLSNSQVVVLQDSQQMGLVYDTTPAPCRGELGSVNITDVLGGGSEPKNFIFNGGTATASTSFPSRAGFVTVTAVNSVTGCQSPTVKAVVTQPDPLELTFSVNEVTFNAGSDGQIVVEKVVGLGDAPFSFSIDGGVTFPYSGTPSPEAPVVIPATTTPGLVAGVYKFVVQSSAPDGCISETIEIDVTEPVRTRVTGTNVIPATVPSKIPNGSVCIETESTETLQYTLEMINAEGGLIPPAIGPQRSPCFNNLAAGTYLITVEPLVITTEGARAAAAIVQRQNGRGNGAYGIVVVAAVSPIVVTATTTAADCITGQGGSIVVNATGGTPPYEYSLNDGPFQTSNVFSNLGAGAYFVTVRDADLHTTTISVTVPGIRSTTSNPVFNFLGKYCPSC